MRAETDRIVGILRRAKDRPESLKVSQGVLDALRDEYIENTCRLEKEKDDLRELYRNNGYPPMRIMGVLINV